MAHVIVIGLLLIAAAVTFRSWRRGVRRRREAFIDTYRLPEGVLARFRQRRPELSDTAVELVEAGLRDYFALCLEAGPGRMVAMPSQVVDDLWHEFILFTRIYQGYCRKALGRFLHHTPAAALTSPGVAQAGIRRAWRLACAREGIEPRAPLFLPLLFAIDAQLGIADGFFYQLDCTAGAASAGSTAFCGSHIGCAAGCGGNSGAADGDGGGGGDSGCSGGGCGGD